MMGVGVFLVLWGVSGLVMFFMSSKVAVSDKLWLWVAYIFGVIYGLAARSCFEYTRRRSQRSTLMPDRWADLQRLRSAQIPFPLPDGITEQQEYILRKFAERQK